MSWFVAGEWISSKCLDPPRRLQVSTQFSCLSFEEPLGIDVRWIFSAAEAPSERANDFNPDGEAVSVLGRMEPGACSLRPIDLGRILSSS